MTVKAWNNLQNGPPSVDCVWWEVLANHILSSHEKCIYAKKAILKYTLSQTKTENFFLNFDSICVLLAGIFKIITFSVHKSASWAQVWSVTYLNIFCSFKSIKLVQQFQHGSLYFRISPTAWFDPWGSNGVDFIHEDNRRCVFSNKK